MSVTKHLPNLLGFLFSLTILYYNFTYNFNITYGYHTPTHLVTLPDVANYKNSAEGKQAFINHLTILISQDNQFLQHMHVFLQKTQHKFIKTHQLSYAQLFWLNYLFGTVNELDLYKKSTWQTLLQQTDIVPSNALLQFSHNNAKNPLLLKRPPSTCVYDDIILSDDTPWLQGPDCYVTRQLLASMVDPTSLIKNQTFPNLANAYANFIFTANVSPAYQQFRNLRDHWRKKHPSATSWQMSTLTETLNPQRMYNKFYYSDQK